MAPKKKATKAAAPAKKKEGMILLTRSQIIEAKDIKEEYVPVPEWAPKDVDPDACHVLVVGLNGHRRDAYQKLLHQARSKGALDTTGFATKYVIAVVTDPETRKQLFNDHDLTLLQAKSTAPMDRIQKMGQKLSGQDDESIKEILDDLGLTPKADSGSDLQAT